jgi:hypothetical protein
VCLRATHTRMSVWKSNFFLQAGLPESLPKPPQRDVAADEEFAEEHGLEPPRRTVGQRGKDLVPRKKRAPSLYNFYEVMRGIEVRQNNSNAGLQPEQTRREYRAFSKHQRSYWEYVQQLYFVFERQQNAADPGKAGETNAHRHKQRLQHKFYFLDETQQRQLVRDYLAQRWEQENYDFVRESCQQDNLRHLVDIRRDLRLLLAKVEDALKPRTADSAPNPPPNV